MGSRRRRRASRKRRAAPGFAAGRDLLVAVAVLAFASPVWAGEPLEERLKTCSRCHGEDGNSTTERIPSLAGHPELYITNQLILMREKIRPAEQMAPFVNDLADPEIQALAAHFAGLERKRSTEPIDGQLFSKGRDLAARLRCGVCHLPDYQGREQIPRLAKQRIDYLVEAMRAFRDDRRIGADTNMNAVMYGLGDADIRSLAHFLAGQ
jgi:cytochrome c553